MLALLSTRRGIAALGPLGTPSHASQQRIRRFSRQLVPKHIPMHTMIQPALLLAPAAIIWSLFAPIVARIVILYIFRVSLDGRANLDRRCVHLW